MKPGFSDNGYEINAPSHKSSPWSLKRGHSLQEGSEEGVKLTEGWEDQGAQ